LKTLAIVTPTYNRANLITNAYQSLEKQTNKDFVWYVVDDGSTDNTVQVMDEIIKKSTFEIKYEKKSNGGKHTALNKAMEIVKEEIVLILDSDDMLTENAADTVIKDYEEIKNDNSICGLGYLKSDFNYKVVGKQYTENGVVDSFTNQRLNKKTIGDKCEVFKTEILKKYPFPVFKGENFVSEATVWCKMSLDYKMKFYNKIIYLCDYQQGGLSDGVHKRLFKNPNGSVACYLSMANKQCNLFNRIKYSIAYTMYSFVAGVKVKKQFKNANLKFMYALTFLPAWLLYLKKKRSFK